MSLLMFFCILKMFTYLRRNFFHFRRQPRENKQKRRRGKTTILTDTTEKNAIESRLQKRQQKMMEKTKRKEDRENRKKVRLVKKRLRKRTFRPADYSSSEEEEFAVPLADSSDSEEDFEDGTTDSGQPEIDDFVIVRFHGRVRDSYYIGEIDGINEDGEYEAKFVRKAPGSSHDERIFFLYKLDDECVFPKEDFVKKLPSPTTVGGTARCQKRFTLPCSLDKWDIA